MKIRTSSGRFIRSAFASLIQYDDRPEVPGSIPGACWFRDPKVVVNPYLRPAPRAGRVALITPHLPPIRHLESALCHRDILASAGTVTAACLAIPSPVDDAFMSPQARRDWLNLKRQSESVFCNPATRSVTSQTQYLMEIS